jgi:Leucine-rich repeat (LRR) protein
MKKSVLPLLVSLIWVGCGNDSESDPPGNLPIPEVRTAIPDANFEMTLVELNLDDEVDGSVLTSRIEGVSNLDLEDRGIADLTGIEDFKALIDLNVRGNALRLLNISSNDKLLFVWAEDNQLSELLLGNNPGIEKIGASGNQLTSLAVADYTSLQLLNLADNALTGMDVSTLPVPSFREFNISGNPLTCIEVSPQQLENIPAAWTKDAEDIYSLDCE